MSDTFTGEEVNAIASLTGLSDGPDTENYLDDVMEAAIPRPSVHNTVPPAVQRLYRRILHRSQGVALWVYDDSVSLIARRGDQYLLVNWSTTRFHVDGEVVEGQPMRLNDCMILVRSERQDRLDEVTRFGFTTTQRIDQFLSQVAS